MENKNAGRLERWWAIEVAKLKAHIAAALSIHKGFRVYIENRLVEVRPLDLPNVDWFWHDESYWKEEITFIGVVSGSWADDTFQIQRWYYGNPRFDTDQSDAL